MGRPAFVACLLIASSLASAADNAAAPQTGAARTPALDQQAVLDLESRIASAQLQRDFKFLESVLAGDMLYIGPDGRKAQRQEYLQQLRNDRVYSQYVNKDLEVHLYGNVAVVDDVHKVAGTFDGAKTALSIVSTKVWAYRAQRWQVVHWQSTAAPPSLWWTLLLKLHGQ